MIQRSTLRARLEPHPPRPPQEITSRAGRNLPAAVSTAVVLLAVLGISLFVRIEIFVALAVVFLSIAVWEAAGAFLSRSIAIAYPVVIGAVALIVISTWAGGMGAGLLSFFLGVGCCICINRVFRRDNSLTDAVAGVLVLSWIGLFGMFAIAIAAMDKGAFAVLTFILLPVANDVGGWCVGVLFGKHPIAPSISPKKSWEGFIGSQLLSLLISFLFAGMVLGLSWPYVIALGVLSPVFATMGDFAESLLKRDLGVKDMGSIFPGHGGMLDRLDSILFCAPLCYVVFTMAS